MAEFHQIVVTPYITGLKNLEHILSKGEAFTKEKSIPEEEVMAWRIAPDMLPLTFQIQTICNGAKNMLGRITGLEQPKVEDTEKTFAELHARIASTLELLQAATPAQFEGKSEAEVKFMIRANEYKFTGLSYVQSFGFPNLYFHITTLYLLFRHHGAPVGKMDYLKGADSA
jgi:hypothetical protein